MFLQVFDYDKTANWQTINVFNLSVFGEKKISENKMYVIKNCKFKYAQMPKLKISSYYAFDKN